MNSHQPVQQWKHSDKRYLSSSENHRARQRKTYHAMKASLNSLDDVLPNLQSTNLTFRCKTKQTILSEAKMYIEYLQMLIWKVGKRLEKSEEELYSYLCWDGFCLNNKSLRLLNEVVPLGPKYLKMIRQTHDTAETEVKIQYQDAVPEYRAEAEENEEDKKRLKSTPKTCLRKRRVAVGTKKRIQRRKRASKRKGGNAKKTDADLPTTDNRPLEADSTPELKATTSFKIQSPLSECGRTVIDDSPPQDARFTLSLSPAPWLSQIHKESDDFLDCEPLDLSSSLQPNPLDLTMKRRDNMFLASQESNEECYPLDLSQCSNGRPHEAMTSLTSRRSSAMTSPTQTAVFVTSSAIAMGSSGSFVTPHRVSDAYLSSTSQLQRIVRVDGNMDDDAESWLESQDSSCSWKDKFAENGYLVVDNLLDSEDVEFYRSIYDKLIGNEIDASKHRHDLGSHAERKVKGEENICQIMWPSCYVDKLDEGKLHKRAHQIARVIFGDDMSFDFDMLIYKAAHTDTVTPMHQDQSYWPDMPDKRTVTIWVALDDVDETNGCMCFVPGSHKNEELRPYRRVKGHHVISCDGDQAELVAEPIRKGGCTAHHGRTVHYTGGNTTDKPRRAFIVNFRPSKMIDFERKSGFDHGKGGVIKMVPSESEKV